MGMKVVSFKVEFAVPEEQAVDLAGISDELKGVATAHGVNVGEHTLAGIHDPVVQSMKEQGLKVWAKRICGISLAEPRVRTKRVKAEVSEVEGLTS